MGLLLCLIVLTKELMQEPFNYIVNSYYVRT